MSKSHFLQRTHAKRLIWLAMFVLLIGATGASGSRAQAQGLQKDAAAYASMFGVTLQEATRRLEFQADAGALDSELQRREPAAFAGLWIDNGPDYKIVVGHTAGGRDAIAPLVPARLRPVVELRLSTHSLAALRAEVLRFADAPARPFDVGINLQENRVEVDALSVDGVVAWARTNSFVLPATLGITTVTSLPQPASDIYGGLEINGSGCTSGFSVVNGSGTRGITLAGHCPDSNSYQGIDLPYVNGTFGGNYDVQWHTASAFTVQNWITDGAVPYTRAITSRTVWGNQPVGGFVCKYGRSSGYGCGTINRKDDIPTCIPGARPLWMRVGVNIIGGDSGGPVFYGESAYGTISCGDAGTLIYSAIDFVESGVGVTVLTSP